MLLVVYSISLICVVTCHPHDDDVVAELDHETHLYFHLLDDHHYVKHLRPAASPNETMDISAELHVTAISSVHNAEDMSIFMDIKMAWHDARLKWNTSDYAGISTIVVPSDVIWRPNIDALSQHTPLHPLRSSAAILQSSGDVSWQISGYVSASCVTDVTMFPAEEKTCEVTLPFGHHHVQKEERVIFHFLNTESSEIPFSSHFHEFLNSDWVLVESSLSVLTPLTDKGEGVAVMSSHEHSDFVRMVFKMSHRPGGQKLTVTGPAVVIACLLPIVFLIPADSSSKVTLGAILLVALCMSLKTAADLLPITSHQGYPKVVVFYVLTMGLTAISIIASVFVSSIANVSSRRQMPMWLRTLFFGTCGLQRWVCASPSNASSTTSAQHPFSRRSGTAESDTDHDVSLKDGDGDNLKDSLRETHVMTAPMLHRGHEWKDAARVLDRLLLFLFVVILLFSFVSLLG